MKTKNTSKPRTVTLLVAALTLLAATPITFAEETAAAKKETADIEIPKQKQTTLGLYITAKHAYAKWKAEPDKVKIIDVRTPEEFIFVGTPEMAWKIPVATQGYEWDAEKKQFPMKLLPDFVDRVKGVAKPGDTLMVMCRSGDRAAIAVNMLAKAGYTDVYNIIDGMEGSDNTDSASFDTKAGWKYTGCPWTKKVTTERMVLPGK